MSSVRCTGSTFCFLIVITSFAQGQIVIDVPPNSPPTSIEHGTKLNLFDSGVLPHLFSMAGGEVSLVGGHADHLFASEGANVKMSGGTAGTIQVVSGSTATIDDGDVEELIVASCRDCPPSTVDLNGGKVSEILNVADGGILNLAGGRISTTSAIPLPNKFGVFGGTVNVSAGSIGDNMIAGTGSSIHLSGGSIGDHFRLDRGDLSISGGQIGNHFQASFGSTVTISEGSVGDSFTASGGLFSIAPGSIVNLSGGSIGNGFVLGGPFRLLGDMGATLNMSGGSVGDQFQAQAGSAVQLFGNEFYIDAERVEGLDKFGDRVSIDDRNVELSGTLIDGMAIKFDLNSDAFDEGAMVNLYRGFPVDYCDFDGDSICSFSDIDSLLASIGSQDLTNDLDYSGTVDSGDVDVWLARAGNKAIGRPYVSGDANLDGKIDPVDLNVVGENWLANVSNWSSGDFTGDGLVDAVDLNKIGKSWGGRTVATVPEPSASSVAVLILLLMARNSRALWMQ